MSYIAVFRSGKICSSPKLRAAVAHNKRDNQNEIACLPHIDQDRTHRNSSLLEPETVDGALARMNARLADAGRKKLRRDAVRAIELIFSLPVDHGVDAEEFFGECLRWAAAEFHGLENIIAADVHLDESNDHCHVLVLPLVNGRMNGSALYGGKGDMSRRLTRFYKCVAEKYGFERPTPALKGAQKAELAKNVRDVLKKQDDPARCSVVWEAINTLIDEDPERFAGLLGLCRPAARARKRKTSTQIFISAGKGPKRRETEPWRNSRSHGSPLDLANCAPLDSAWLGLINQVTFGSG